MQVLSAMSDGASFDATRAILIYSRIPNEPKVAVSPYDYDEDMEENNIPRQSFATLHPVSIGEGDVPVIGAGHCLSRQDLEKLTRSLLHEQVSLRAVLPPSILCADSGCLAWFKPAHVAPIYFAARDDKFTRRLNAKRVLHPTLLFIAAPGSLSVFALASSERPDNDTLVYVAPYFNLYDRGAMCRGNAVYPPDVAPDRIDAWEEAFFRTQFTHSNYATAKLTHHKGGHDGLWAAMMDKAAKVTAGQETADFPAQYLVAAQPASLAVGKADKSLTVKDVLNAKRQGAY